MHGAPLADPDAVLMRTFASAHAVLHVREGEFVSLLEPPDDLAEAAAACRNTGVWPVLVGGEARRERDTMLASPIILYDYPKIAPESAGDLFDGAEIDEILTLRIMTMTDAEKAEMRQVDDYARRILERTEAMPPEQLMKMHGTVRELRPLEPDFFNPASKLEGATVAGVYLKAGDHVRIRPKRRADAMDLVLAGKDAVIEAVEQDVDGGIHFALVLADDPGRDMGFARMVGHRFFYGSDEVEPLEGAS
jgi:hydrogenase maturation protease